MLFRGKRKRNEDETTNGKSSSPQASLSSAQMINERKGLTTAQEVWDDKALERLALPDEDQREADKEIASLFNPHFFPHFHLLNSPTHPSQPGRFAAVAEPGQMLDPVVPYGTNLHANSAPGSMKPSAFSRPEPKPPFASISSSSSLGRPGSH